MTKKKILLKVENVGDKRINKHYSHGCNMTNRPDSKKVTCKSKVNKE